MTHPFGPFFLPELRWDPGHGYAYLAEAIDDAIALGVGGFVLTGGPREEVIALTRELHRRSRHPLLIAASAERGAGERFAGATGLPPAAALGVLNDVEVVRRAARLTARELRALGVNWALAPVCELDVEPANPFTGARAFGGTAQRTAEWVAEWIDACQAEGVLACAKHYPGIGRALADPHLSAAHIEVPPATLWAEDLLPFRGAVDTGVASVLASHVVFPTLDASGAAASRSAPLLQELLRGELHFDGLIVSDALSVPGASWGTDESTAAIDSLAAGCDLLLAPSDPVGLADVLEAARNDGLLDDRALDASRGRRDFWADWARPEGSSAVPREATLDDVLWGRQVADTVVHVIRGVMPNIGPVVDVIQVEDDVAGGRSHFVSTLEALDLTPRLVTQATEEGRGAVVIALFGEAGAGRGRAGYSEVTRRRVAQAVADARQHQRSSVVLIFGHPRLAAQIPEAANVVCCWGGDRAMQEAAARRLG